MSYKLRNVATGHIFEDSGWCLDDPQSPVPSLVRAEYDEQQITFGDMEQGIYRFADWLPINRRLCGSSAPVTYRSRALASYLGLKNLYITMSGYFPKVGAEMTTCSFKETEAYSVCGRMVPGDGRVMVVASAGNTARAFARVCSDNGIPLLLCVPEDNLSGLWFESPVNDCVKLVSVASGADYFDAIDLGNAIVSSPRFYAEGGAKNVARRDGMGTTMLSATEVIGRIPDYYFQAVGSGTGAIAAWEANLRLIADGRFGENKARLVVSQNAPFLPMYDAWCCDSRVLLDFDDNHARGQVEMIDAKVLSNRRPPYSIVGGVYDAVKDTCGEVVCVDNAAAQQACELFEKLEGVDLNPAAGVAVASLIDYVKQQKLDAQSVVMLNITGAGERLLKSRIAARGAQVHYLRPSIVFDKVLPPVVEIVERVESLYAAPVV